MQRRGRAGAGSRRSLRAILPAAALVLLLQTAGQAAAISAAGSASPHRLKVEIEARTVAVTRAERTALGVKPSIVSTQLRCDPGEVALMAGASADKPGVSVLASLPTGPRSYRLELGNFDPANATATLSELCVRQVAAPRLGVGTGTVTVTVPAARVAGTGLVPGTARVTGTCTKNAIPVSSGYDLGEEGVLSIAESFPSGPRKLIIIVRNAALEARQALVTVRCVDLPDGFGVTRVTGSAAIGPAAGDGGAVEPGEAGGTKTCPSGKVMIGGGHRAPENAFGDTFPTLRNGAVMGYLFRSFSLEAQAGSIVVFCTPRMVPARD